MRQADPAIITERYPLPTVGEILLNLSKYNLFSKVVLSTTFATLWVVQVQQMRFGVNVAPMIYQCEIRKVVQGVANMCVDIVMSSIKPNVIDGLKNY